jgi:tRNA (mo5U34)-methyltransferase
MTIAERIASVPLWRHRIVFPDGAITPGSQDTLAQLPTIALPADLSGQTVLDVGCSDGFYSFECEKRGAARVLAVDNYSSVYIDSPSGFRVAHEVLGSRVEFLESDLFDLDPARIGQFDLVLCLGVLYHLRHPLLGIERLAPLCRNQLILETGVAGGPVGRRAKLAAFLTGATPPRHWMQLYVNDEINADPTSYWAPSEPCAEEMMRLCGFCDVQTVSSKQQRGVFHGFSPAHGADVERLLSNHGGEIVAGAAMRVLGRSMAAGDVVPVLKAASIVQFAQIRQIAAEMRAKDWHRRGRWEQPNR